MSMNLQTTYSETPAAAFQGQLIRKDQVRPAKNADTAHMLFGSPVVFKPSGGTSDIDVTVPANSSDILYGIVYRTDSYAPAWTDSSGTQGEMDSTGILPNVIMDVLTDGEIWVKCTTACAPGDRLYVSYSTGSTYTAAGQFGNAAESGHTIDCTTKGEWLSTATAGNFAKLRLFAGNK